MLLFERPLTSDQVAVTRHDSLSCEQDENSMYLSEKNHRCLLSVWWFESAELFSKNDSTVEPIVEDKSSHNLLVRLNDEAVIVYNIVCCSVLSESSSFPYNNKSSLLMVFAMPRRRRSVRSEARSDCTPLPPANRRAECTVRAASMVLPSHA